MGWSHIYTASRNKSLSTEFFGLFGGNKSKVNFNNFLDSLNKLKNMFTNIKLNNAEKNLDFRLVFKYKNGREWFEHNLYNLKAVVECAEQGIDNLNTIKSKIKPLNNYVNLKLGSDIVTYLSLYYENDDYLIPYGFISIKNLPDNLKAKNKYSELWDEEHYKSELKKVHGDPKEMYLTSALPSYAVLYINSSDNDIDVFGEANKAIDSSAYKAIAYDGSPIFTPNDIKYAVNEIDKLIDRVNKIENKESLAAKCLHTNYLPGYYFPS